MAQHKQQDISQPTSTQSLENLSSQTISQFNSQEFQVGKLIGVNDNLKIISPIYAGTSLILGRHRNCDILLKCKYSSNWHCRIYTHRVELCGRQDEILVFCEDLSYNGTLWNGKKIGRDNSVILCHGDTLEIPKGFYVTYEQNATILENEGPEKFVDNKRYQITSKLLGTGAFAEVRLALDKRTRNQLAVKIMDRTKVHSISPMNGNDIQREIQILKSIQHPNIVCITDVIDDGRYSYIFLQLVAGGDLFDYVKTSGRLIEDEAIYLSYQLLQAMQYLHDRKIVHRDLKPENILLASSAPFSQLFITDFGMAKIQESRMKTLCGTLTYAAPELLKGKNYTQQIDCWALGLIFYIMLAGKHPFTDGNESDETVRDRIRKGKVPLAPSLFENVSESALRVISGLLYVDPAYRFTVKDALSSRWIQSCQTKLIQMYTTRVLDNWNRRLAEEEITLKRKGVHIRKRCRIAGAAVSSFSSPISSSETTYSQTPQSPCKLKAVRLRNSCSDDLDTFLVPDIEIA